MRQHSYSQFVNLATKRSYITNGSDCMSQYSISCCCEGAERLPSSPAVSHLKKVLAWLCDVLNGQLLHLDGVHWLGLVDDGVVLDEPEGADMAATADEVWLDSRHITSKR